MTTAMQRLHPLGTDNFKYINLHGSELSFTQAVSFNFTQRETALVLFIELGETNYLYLIEKTDQVNAVLHDYPQHTKVFFEVPAYFLNATNGLPPNFRENWERGAINPSTALYQLWIALGNAGTIAEMLESLRGYTGPRGNRGLEGPRGTVGPRGPTGPEGRQPWLRAVDWEPNRDYKVGPPASVVRRSGLWVCAFDHTSTNVFEPDRWSLLLPDINLVTAAEIADSVIQNRSLLAQIQTRADATEDHLEAVAASTLAAIAAAEQHAVNLNTSLHSTIDPFVAGIQSNFDNTSAALVEANLARDLARKWATQTTGEVIAGQGYSSRKHALDAAESARLAADALSKMSDNATRAEAAASRAAQFDPASYERTDFLNARFSEVDGNLTPGQTVFTPPGGYTVGGVRVYLNGMRIVKTKEYTATNGTTVTLSAGVGTGDVVEIEFFKVNGVLNVAPLRHTHPLEDLPANVVVTENLDAAVEGSIGRQGFKSAAKRDAGEGAGQVPVLDAQARLLLKLIPLLGLANTDGLSAYLSSHDASLVDLYAQVAARAAKSGDALTGALEFAESVTLTAASTVDMGAAASNNITLNGTAGTQVKSLGSPVKAGGWRLVRFVSGLVLVHHSTNLAMPGGANIITESEDAGLFRAHVGGWRCLLYQRASGRPLASDDEEVERAARVRRIFASQNFP